MFWFGVHYRVEEVSSWRAGQLENVAVKRGTDGLEAYRVQAKTLADFRRRHPGFVQHWDSAIFGRPWLSDYPSSPPERRIDLDLKGTPLREGCTLRLRWRSAGSDGCTGIIRPCRIPAWLQERPALRTTDRSRWFTLRHGMASVAALPGIARSPSLHGDGSNRR